MNSLARGFHPVETSPTNALLASNQDRSARWRRWAMPLVGSVFATLALAAPAAIAQGAPAPSTSSVPGWDAPEPWRTDRYYLQTSVASAHFDQDEQNNALELINAEWRLDKRWLAGQVLVGAATFQNSFDQATWYAYGGLLWRPVDAVQPFYLKLTAGVLHGYRGKYQDKIPFNDSGYAPVILPGMGYCYKRFCSELVVYGAAGMFLSIGMTLP
ncbi:MAG TPA: hypothetical protein DHV85_13265 [Candidatus Accumulibacter sp.]|nr:hypothetical protein [Accumulibacter sp.]